MKRCVRSIFRGLALLVALGGPEISSAAEGLRPVEFDRDILPIFSDKCFACHGPDASKRKADLRLDTEDGILADRNDGDLIVVPGASEASELYARIVDPDESRRMPEAKSHIGRLTTDQIILIKRWIDEGASYKRHWAFVAPVRPGIPRPREQSWVRNAIDSFVLERLEREGLKPSPEADKATLLRRVSFDLTGLPPTAAELKSFLLDTSSTAYEKQVDRLLASPHYGENMARVWLDLARYADSNGYAEDKMVTAWPWRDWIVDAYNRNMPYDQFTIRQIAGDLLPNATLEDKIATGFNRNNIARYKGDEDEDENRTENVIDRVSTVGTTWLGLTMGCARCHDHKYDPITQRDFYRLFAFFNNVDEGEHTPNGNAAPVVSLASSNQKRQATELQKKIKAVLNGIPEKTVIEQANEWRKTALTQLKEPSREGLVGQYEFDDSLRDSTGRGADATVSGIKKFEEGVAGQAFKFDGTTRVDFDHLGDFAPGQPFAMAFWLSSSSEGAQSVFHRFDTEKSRKGYEISLEDPTRGDNLQTRLRIVVRFSSDWPSHILEVRSTEHCISSVPIVTDTQNDDPAYAHHVVLNYDGSGRAQGVTLFLDGAPLETEVVRDDLAGSYQTSAPLSIGDEKSSRLFRGGIGDFRIYERVLSAEEAKGLAIVLPTRRLLEATVGQSVTEIPTLQQREATWGEDAEPPAAHKAEKRKPLALVAEMDAMAAEGDAARQQQLSDRFLRYFSPEAERAAYTSLLQLLSARDKLESEIPSAMVMSEMNTPRENFVLWRGQYGKNQEKVTPGVPAFLLPLPSGSNFNRMTLAKWLVDSNNPLPARVEMNREWQSFFGVGIVKTAEDFGSQGEAPSHPELLDWLALEFIQSGWDVKVMQRLMVTSATYRQSSIITPALLERDPENRLLARGPRVRLAAEQIRDNVLAVSGLLSSKMGGPSVYPYAPTGFWRSGARSDEYTQGTGEDLYRRSLYTVWKRTIAPASFYAFDVPTRERCTARRIATNTPLQALTLLNDPTVVEASRALAEGAILRGGMDNKRRVAIAFRLIMQRDATASERVVLLNEAKRVLKRFRNDPDAAKRLISVGDLKRRSSVDPTELATWTIVVRTIFNLNEAITKD